MDPIEEFEQIFEATYGAYRTLMQNATGVIPPAVDNPTFLQVSEYLDILNTAEQNMRDIPDFALTNILTNPIYAGQLNQEARDFIQALLDDDFDTAFAPLDEARAIVAGVAGNVIMQDVIDPQDGGDTGGGDTGGGDTGGGDTGGGDTGGGDTGGGDTGGGDTGGGDTGGGDTGGSTIEQTFAQFQARLDALLWTEQSGIYSSPTFNVDDSSGAWVSTGTGQDSLGGSTLADFYGHLGEAAALAVMSYIASQQSIVNTLTGQGVDSSALNAAVAAAETAMAEALEKLQELGAMLTDQATMDPTSVQAQASAAAQSLLSALAAQLPGLGSDLDAMIVGSRNSEPSFVVSPDGSAEGSEHGDWFYLSKNADSFDGGLGADMLFGLEGNDTLDGGGDEDALFGGVGDDLLMGGQGDDAVHGGAGDADVAEFSGEMGRYTLKLANDGSVVVEDRAANGDGTDLLTGIEDLSFSEGATIFTDGILDLSVIQGITGLNEADIGTFIELYIAYFNRAPDALGLYFWGSQFANGLSLDAIAADFLNQVETRATYPEGETNLAFATQVYSNVLGRTPDADGLNFWVGQLDGGGVSRGTFILEVLKGAKASPEFNDTQESVDLRLADRAYLEDKTDIGTYFSVIKGLSDVPDASAAMQLYVRGDDSSIQTAVAKIDQDYAAAATDGSGELLLQLVGVADDPFAV